MGKSVHYHFGQSIKSLSIRVARYIYIYAKRANISHPNPERPRSMVRPIPFASQNNGINQRFAQIDTIPFQSCPILRNQCMEVMKGLLVLIFIEFLGFISWKGVHPIEKKRCKFQFGQSSWYIRVSRYQEQLGTHHIVTCIYIYIRIYVCLDIYRVQCIIYPNKICCKTSRVFGTNSCQKSSLQRCLEQIQWNTSVSQFA